MNNQTNNTHKPKLYTVSRMICKYSEPYVANDHYVYTPSDEAIKYQENAERHKKLYPDDGSVFAYPGNQTEFLVNPATWCISNGGYGSAKTFALLMYLLQFIHMPHFRGGLYRREMPEITKSNGMLDETRSMYKMVNGELTEKPPKWQWEHKDAEGNVTSTALVEFGCLPHPKDVKDLRGISYSFAGIDEGNLFEKMMVQGLAGRLRNPKCRVKPLLRITTNADPTCWIRPMIDWYIGHDGYPIRVRSGVVRYFFVDPITGLEVWAATYDECEALIRDGRFDGQEEFTIPEPTSFSIVFSDLRDNLSLMEDKGYATTVSSMSPVERDRYINNNWDRIESAGKLFQQSWCEYPERKDIPPLHAFNKICLGFDIASTEPHGKNKSPDATTGTAIGEYVNEVGQKIYYVLDHMEIRENINQVYIEIEAFCKKFKDENVGFTVSIPTEFGMSNASAEEDTFTEKLKDYDLHRSRDVGKKTHRFRAFSAKSHDGLVKIVKAPWNNRFVAELQMFGEDMAYNQHDDVADSCSRAMNYLIESEGDHNPLRANA